VKIGAYRREVRTAKHRRRAPRISEGAPRDAL
jgi:hypothetical protein